MCTLSLTLHIIIIIIIIIKNAFSIKFVSLHKKKNPTYYS
jgi:hypothetical protein